MASSGIAALLLDGGRTAHSRFKIPLELTSSSTCNIKINSPEANLIRETKLIIWDEAPMAHRHAIEAVDRTIRDIMKSIDPSFKEIPFGNKVILFGGDFRQILPVVKDGSMNNIKRAQKRNFCNFPVRILIIFLSKRHAPILHKKHTNTA